MASVITQLSQRHKVSILEILQKVCFCYLGGEVWKGKMGCSGGFYFCVVGIVIAGSSS